MHSKLTFASFRLLAFFALILLITSCKQKPGIWANDKMNAGKRSDFHDLNKTVLEGLQDNQLKALQFSMSKELMEDAGTIRKVELISYKMKHDQFNLLNEYYICGKPGTQITIGERNMGVNNFDANFTNENDEMYVAFFVSKDPLEKSMLTAIYEKYDYGWKLRDLTLNPYTTAGKTAPELYKTAQERYSKGYLIDAVNLMSLAQTCYAPADSWQYLGSADMIKFSHNLLAEANAKFPYVLEQVKTRPEIISIFNQKTSAGPTPMVYYLSKVNIKDTVAIKQENDEIKKVIGTVMPGIDKDKKYLLYAAFNQRPNAKTSVNHYDMTAKLP
jgi:hypothetical protein